MDIGADMDSYRMCYIGTWFFGYLHYIFGGDVSNMIYNNSKTEKQMNAVGALNEKDGRGESTSGTLNSREADVERAHDKTGLSKYVVYLY